jgi:hypothetical protein
LPVALVALVTLLVYVLHQDFWFWRSARPLVFGFLPVGLAYHAAYTLGISVLMLYLVRRHWPGHLEHAGDPAPGPRSGGATPRGTA